MKVLKPETIPFPNNGQFIRNSTATYIEDGILKTAGVNEPRWQDGKLLLEGAATNLLNSSSEFSDVAWGKTVTVTANTVVAPDGSASADTLEDTSTGDLQDVSRIVNIGVGAHTFSVWLRSISPCTSRIAIRDGGGVITFKDVLVTAEWQRFSVSSSNSASPAGAGAVWIYVRATNSETGVLYAWGSQLEQSSATTSYIPTTATPVTRAADICIGNFSRASTGTYIDNNGALQTAGVNVPRIQGGRLLLEGEATNIVLQSNNLGASPWLALNCTRSTGPVGLDGVTPSTTLTVPSTGASFVYQGPNVGAARREIWVHAKAGVGGILVMRIDSPAQTVVVFNLSAGTITSGSGTIVPLSNGWFRCGLSLSSAIVNIVLRPAEVVGNSVHIDHVQIEEGEAATSRIPTPSAPVTRAADIHSAGLVYTTATEVRPLWSSATTYSVGQIIRYNNVVYESLQATNLNNQPDISPTWWLSLGADNISAAFDGKVGSKTTATDKLRMIVYPGNVVDAVGYLETNAVVVNTSAIDSYGNIAYSNSTGFTESNIENWYDYFFVSPLADPTTQVVHQGIPSLDPGLFVGIEMIRPGTVEVGSVLMGYSTTIGKTQYGVKAGIVDYSKKESDEFGNVSIVERPYSKRMQGDVYVNNYDLNKVQRFLYNIRATPVLWMASDNPELAEVSYVYGFYKDFSTTISYPDVSMCNLDIEGLV